MNNPILLNALFWEWENEQYEKCMHMDDIKAIQRVHELLARELPKSEVISDAEDDIS